MTVQQQIENKIQTAFEPQHMEVFNESHMHHVPPGSESHFKLVLVSHAFEGKTLVDRHRMVNETLIEELKKTLHALSLHTLTPDEWEKKAGQVSASPQCKG